MKKRVRREILALAALIAVVAAALVVARLYTARGNSVKPLADLGAAVDATVDVGYRAGADAYLLIQVEQQYAMVPLDSDGTLTIAQPGGERNTIAIGQRAFFMESANCDNQDCIHQGAVTLENRERRVMGDYVICLPNRVVLEMMDAGEAAAYVESSTVGTRR